MTGAEKIWPRPVRHALPSGVELHALHWDPPSRATPLLRPWLLVHGLASNARLWDGVAWRLAQQGHPVVAVDPRPHRCAPLQAWNMMIGQSS